MRVITRRGFTLVACTLAVLMAGAQTDTSRILGSVLDQTQVVGVALTIMDTQRGLTRSRISNDAGEYLVRTQGSLKSLESRRKGELWKA